MASADAGMAGTQDWPRHVVRASDHRECPDQVTDPQRHREKIEPWLSALFQADHLNLLVGSGFGLGDDAWIARVAGPNSRLALAEMEVCADYTAMEALRRDYFEQGRDNWVGRIGRRMKTIAEERTLNFLSRKAVIPKYGFPVDVVELEVRSTDGRPTGVALQRDLSQAIAEYAPGGKVVANKLEWESCGVKAVAGKAWPVSTASRNGYGRRTVIDKEAQTWLGAARGVGLQSCPECLRDSI